MIVPRTRIVETVVARMLPLRVTGMTLLVGLRGVSTHGSPDAAGNCRAHG